jgi:hypothetical protein
MEGLERLVSESFARHSVETALDYRRLQWSDWFPCTDSVRLVQLSSKPGLFALADEIIPPGEVPVGSAKRMLALFRISEADDLGMALGRLFLPGGPEPLTDHRCFARYAVIEDASQRHTAYSAFQRWLASSAISEGGPTESRELKTEIWASG